MYFTASQLSQFSASLEMTDKYTKMFTRNVLYLLFDKESSLWMGRPTLLQLKRLEQDMDPPKRMYLLVYYLAGTYG